MQIYIYNNKNNLHINRSKLSALSPMAILERGYSITRSLRGAQVIRNAGSVSTGDRLQILLGSGSLEAAVTERRVVKDRGQRLPKT